MKKIAITVLSTALLVSCGTSNEKTQETKEEKKETTTTETAKTENTAESLVVLNANLATQEELMKAGIYPETIKKIIENRPFVSINELEALISDENREATYKKVFVPLNLNTTPEEDFKKIPRVGDKMAHEFEEYRPYTSIKQFKKEIGKYVDEEEVDRYLYYVFVPVELNTASEEDIKALPGVGDKMAHEFEEYRPYKNIEQFRKEIGKYVDDKELKRLERFVYLK